MVESLIKTLAYELVDWTYFFQAQIICLSDNAGMTKLNEHIMKKDECLPLCHKDVFTIGDRLFR